VVSGELHLLVLASDVVSMLDARAIHDLAIANAHRDEFQRELKVQGMRLTHTRASRNDDTSGMLLKGNVAKQGSAAAWQLAAHPSREIGKEALVRRLALRHPLRAERDPPLAGAPRRLEDTVVVEDERLDAAPEPLGAQHRARQLRLLDRRRGD
jgi:hypothetical protein